MTAVGPGSAMITASFPGATQGTAPVTVTSAVLTALTVSPPNLTAPSFAAVQYRAVGSFSDGRSTDLTNGVIWNSSNTAAATIGKTGLATLNSSGTATISATAASISGATTLIVTPAVRSVVVTSRTASIPLGTTQQYVATCNYIDGTSRDVTSASTWSSSAPGVATVGPGGLAASHAQGQTNIAASYFGVTSAFVALTVTPPVLTSIAIIPNAASVPLGLTKQLRATGTYSDGSVQDLTATASWVSSPPGIATVSAGLATSQAEGTTTISASVGTIGGGASLTVAPPALVSVAISPAGPTMAPGGYQLFLHLVGTFTDRSTREVPGTWSSSDNRVAAIDGFFAVSGQAGSVTISGTPTSGSVTPATTTLTVAVPPAGYFALTNPTNVGRSGHSATLLRDGRVLIAGGNSYPDNLRQVTAEIYDLATGTFARTSSSLSEARANASALRLPDGRVLISGGYGESGYALATAELYDPATDAFTPTGRMNHARSTHASFLLPNGKALIVGGDSAVAELYDPDSGTFSLAASMSARHLGGAAVQLPDRSVLVAGGDAYSTLSEVYDPATASFHAVGSLNTGRVGPSGSLLGNGLVLIAGGVDLSGYLTSAELFDPRTGVFRSTGSMLNAHGYAPMVQLSNGNALIIEGFDAEMFDYESETFAQSAPSHKYHEQSDLTLLDDGTALVASGFLPDSEIYHPSAAATLVALTVTPIPPTAPSLYVGAHQQFVATGTMADGSTRDLTKLVAWGSSDPTIANISAGLATGFAAGQIAVSASFGAIIAYASLAVTQPPVYRLESRGSPDDFTPAVATIQADATQSSWAYDNVYGSCFIFCGPNGTNDQSSGVSSSSAATPFELLVTAPRLPDGAVLQSAVLKLHTVLSTSHTSYSQTACYTSYNGISGQATCDSFSSRIDDSGTVFSALTTPAGTTSLSGASGSQDVDLLALGLGGILGAGTTVTISGSTYVNGSGWADWQNPNCGNYFNNFVYIRECRGGGYGYGDWVSANTYQVVTYVNDAVLVEAYSMPRPIVSLAITPAQSSTTKFFDGLPNQAVQFRASAAFDDGSTQDVTALVNWSSSNAAAALMGTPRGFAYPGRWGLTTISASLNSTRTSTPIVGSATLMVTSFDNSGMIVSRRRHAATRLNDGRVLISGGDFADHSLEIDGLGSIPLVATTAAPRAGHASTLLNDGRVLLSGGGSNGCAPPTPCDSAEVYDPATNATTLTGSMSASRIFHTATLLNDGRVLIAGGSNSTALATADIYDPASGTFTPTGTMNIARAEHSATLLNDGRVLICGGDTIGSAEIYDPLSGTFTPTGTMSVIRHAHTATLLNDGRVLVAGGRSDRSSVASDTAELYDPSTGVFTPTGTMVSGRSSHRATLLNDGLVLMTGGIGDATMSNTAISAVELYDVVKGVFLPGGALRNAHYEHTATLLNDGQVLIAGGLINSATVLDIDLAFSDTNFTTVTVSLPEPSVAVGTAATMRATGIDTYGNAEILQSVRWSSSDSRVATVTNDETNNGHVYGVAPGMATITACVRSVCGSTTVTVQE